MPPKLLPYTEVPRSNYPKNEGNNRQIRLDELRKTCVDGPVLVIPGGSHSYDTRGAVVLQGIGTVYFGPFRASGVWGKLEAEKGDSYQAMAAIALWQFQFVRTK